MAQEIKETILAMMEQTNDEYFCCIICTQPFSDANPPMLFQCKHTFCKKCVTNKQHMKNYANGYQLCVVDRTRCLRDAPDIKNAFFQRCMNMMKQIRRKLDAKQEDILMQNIRKTKQSIEQMEYEIQKLCQQYYRANIVKERYEKYQALDKPKSIITIQNKIKEARQNNSKLKNRLDEVNQRISNTSNDLQALRRSKYEDEPTKKRKGKNEIPNSVIPKPQKFKKAEIAGNPFDILDD